MGRTALADLHDLVDGLDPADVAHDRDAVVELMSLLAKTEAKAAATAAAFAAQAGHAAEFPTTPAWLAARAHVPRPDAVRLLRLGRACLEMPNAAEAWTAGEITGRHVGALASKGCDEPLLIEHAKKLTFSSFTKALRYWHQLQKPDDAEAQAEQQVEERRLHLSETFESAWRLDGLGDPISGSIVDRVLRGIVDELFEQDWAEAKERLGRDDVTSADLRRTPAQRRWDAFVEMATRAATAPKDGHRPRPLLSVLIDFPTLAGRICELSNGTVVTPGSLLPYLDEALVRRIVWQSPTRGEVSETARFFTGATRAFIEARDRECTLEPGCDHPIDGSHIDHIQPYARGGLTTTANGRMGCEFHNLLRNRQPNGP